MKQLSIFLYLIVNLALAPVSMANFMAKNAEGVTITYIDESFDETGDTNKQTTNVANEILMNAISLEGVKYKYGGASPATGFDCSGFVNYVYEHAANINLPRTSRDISRVGQSVDRDNLQPGDLVFFKTTRSAFSHVGIYMGDDNFIHAPSKGGHVRVDSMLSSYWHKRFNGAKRLVEIAQVAQSE